jgi:hypothetical protein
MSIWTNCPYSRLKLWTLLTVALFFGRYLGISAEWGNFFAIDCRGIPRASVVGWVFERCFVEIEFSDKSTPADDGFNEG